MLMTWIANRHQLQGIQHCCTVCGIVCNDVVISDFMAPGRGLFCLLIWFYQPINSICSGMPWWMTATHCHRVLVWFFVKGKTNGMWSNYHITILMTCHMICQSCVKSVVMMWVFLCCNGFSGLMCSTLERMASLNMMPVIFVCWS